MVESNRIFSKIYIYTHKFRILRVIEELIKLRISTVRSIAQTEAISFVGKVLSIVVRDKQCRWRDGPFVSGTGIASKANDDIRPFTDPVHHQLLVTVIEVGSLEKKNTLRKL